MGKKISSYKVRKSGNSDITTIPQEVKETLGIETGDKIEFLIKEDDTVTIQKAIDNQTMDDLIEESIAQYHTLLEKLVDM